MTHYEYVHTATTTASPDAVYALWADVGSWPVWDAGVEAATIDGPFVAGARGSMTIEGPMLVEFVLVDVEPGVGFLDETVLPDLVLRFDHRVRAAAAGAEVTVRVTLDGPAAGDMGPLVTADTPEAVAALVRMAERAPAPA